MSRKKPPEKSGIDQKKLIELIVKAMAKNPRQPLNYKQIAAKLKITEKEEKRALSEALLRMKKDGTVDQTTLKNAITIDGDPVSYTNEDSTRITTWLQDNWDKTIGN